MPKNAGRSFSSGPLWLRLNAMSIWESLKKDVRENRPPAWVIALIAIISAMGAYLIAVFDAVFMFAHGGGFRFALVFLIAWPVGFLFFFSWTMQIKSLHRDREANRARAQQVFQNLSNRGFAFWLIVFAILVVLWIFRNVTLFQLP